MSIDALLLDLGNVFVFHDNVALMRAFAARSGISGEALAARLPADFWDRINRGRVDEAGIRREFEKALGVVLDPADFFELWNSHFTIHEALVARVETWVGRVKLVLLSNTNEPHMRWVRPRLPILRRFDALVLSYELGLAKPDRAIFEVALQRAGVPAARAAFFDDVPEYVEAAGALGIQGRVFTTAEAFDRQLRDLGLG